MIRQTRLVNLFVFGALVFGLLFTAVGPASAATSGEIGDESGSISTSGGTLTSSEGAMSVKEEDTLDQQLYASKPLTDYCRWLGGRVKYHQQVGNSTRFWQLVNRWSSRGCYDAFGPVGWAGDNGPIWNPLFA